MADQVFCLLERPTAKCAGLHISGSDERKAVSTSGVHFATSDVRDKTPAVETGGSESLQWMMNSWPGERSA